MEQSVSRVRVSCLFFQRCNGTTSFVPNIEVTGLAPCEILQKII